MISAKDHSDLNLFETRLNEGICPRCGVRFGTDRMDETNIRRIAGTDPHLLDSWGAYQELIAPCGHRIKCFVTAPSVEQAAVVRTFLMDQGPAKHSDSQYDWIGPCAHDRDPYNRCDICSQLTPEEAQKLAEVSTGERPDFSRAVDDGNDGFGPGQLVLHYRELLSNGWRATRWEHLEFGTEEHMPSGGWKWTKPNGTSIERGRRDGKIVVNGHEIAPPARSPEEAQKLAEK